MRNLPMFLVAAACGLAAGAAARADVVRGKALSEQFCAGCHAVKPGQESPVAKAPTFLRSASDPSITETSLKVFLRTPHWTMPNIVLKPDDSDDVVEYILSLKPKR